LGKISFDTRHRSLVMAEWNQNSISKFNS